MRKLVKKIAVSILINFDTGIEEWQIKRFDEWMGVKEKIHYEASLPAIKNRQIWWCGFGENVGIEINGKNETFSRPVLIFKKLGSCGFLGIPLTSVPHTGSWYVRFIFKNKPSFAALSQIRVFSTARLYRYIGMISPNDLETIKTGFKKLYLE